MSFYIYIAGPYSKGNVEANVSSAITAANKMLDAGMFPFCPHLFHFWDKQHPRNYQEWLNLDLAWMSQCDAVLRLPGISPGADVEEAEARKQHIPVYYDVDEMIRVCNVMKKRAAKQ